MTGNQAVSSESVRRLRCPAPLIDELHDEIGQPFTLAVIEDGRNVGVQEPGGVHCLVAEPQREQLLVLDVGAHHLDRDVSTEHLVPAGPDISHPARGDVLPEGVPPPQHEALVQPVHGASTRPSETFCGSNSVVEHIH